MLRNASFRKNAFPFVMALAIALGIVGLAANRAPAGGGGGGGTNNAFYWTNNVLLYNQNFDNLSNFPVNNAVASGWIDANDSNGTLTAWYADYESENESELIVGSAGSHGAGSLLSLGNHSETERALGAFPNDDTGDIAWGLRFQNFLDNPIRALRLTFDGEQWIDGPSPHTTQFFYRIGGTTFELAGSQSDWTPITDGDVTYNAGNVNTPVPGGVVTNFNLLINGLWIEPGDDFWFGWLDTNDSAGSDHEVGIDNVTVELISVLVDDFDDYVDGLEIVNNAANANPDTRWLAAANTNFPVVVNGEVRLGNGDSADGITQRQLSAPGSFGAGATREELFSGFVFRYDTAPTGNVRVTKIEDSSDVTVGTVWAVPANNGEVRLGISRDTAAGPDIEFNQNLAPDTNYSVVLGSEFIGDYEARLWINPANAGGNNDEVVVMNGAGACQANYVELAQGNDPTSRLFIDDLTVATEFDVANPPSFDFSADNPADTTLPPGEVVVVAQVALDAGNHVASTLRELVLTATGGIDDATDIDSVALWIDRDGSGDFDETLDAPALDTEDSGFGSDDGTLTFSDPGLTVAAGENATLFVVYDLLTTATTGEAFSVELTSADMFGRVTGLPVTGRSVTAEPGTVTFTTSVAATGFGKTGGSQTADILAVTVSVDGADVTLNSINVNYVVATNVAGVDVIGDGTTIATASAIAEGTTETITFSPAIDIADGEEESFTIRATVTGEGARLQARITGASLTGSVDTIIGLPTPEGVITIDNGGSTFGLLLVVPLLGLAALVVVRR